MRGDVELAARLHDTAGVHSRPRLTRQICPGPALHLDDARAILRGRLGHDLLYARFVPDDRQHEPMVVNGAFVGCRCGRGPGDLGLESSWWRHVNEDLYEQRRSEVARLRFGGAPARSCAAWLSCIERAERDGKPVPSWAELEVVAPSVKPYRAGEVIEPHWYHPDAQAMGDCSVCGRLADSALHIRSEVKP